jgi:hypothetical protein
VDPECHENQELDRRAQPTQPVAGAGAARSDRRTDDSGSPRLESGPSRVVWKLGRTNRPPDGGSPVAWGPSRTRLGDSRCRRSRGDPLHNAPWRAAPERHRRCRGYCPTGDSATGSSRNRTRRRPDHPRAWVGPAFRGAIAPILLRSMSRRGASSLSPRTLRSAGIA